MAQAEDTNPQPAAPLNFFDRPNSYIGRSVPRPGIKRLLSGGGRYVDDIVLPRMVHAVYVRSPHAHARIKSIDLEAVKAADGVVAVFTGAEIKEHIEPFIGVLTHLEGLRSAPQYPVAVEFARWQGEPVALVIADTRALGEDAAMLADIEYEPLPAVCDMTTALDKDTPVIHDEFDSNLAWERVVEGGDVEAAFNDGDNVIVERVLNFARHTGVTLEPRGTVAEYEPHENRLTIHYNGQAPHMMQAVYAKHLGIPEENVRIIARDVGGSFGIKVHTYGDEVAIAVAARLLRRPIKYIVDRFESFQADIHARDHRVEARIAVSKDGKIKGFEMDDLTGIGPYSMYPRSSAIECNQVLNLTGGPYDIPAYKARGRVVFQNKTMMCQYRAVGHPVAMAVSEVMADQAARAVGLDPLEFRRRNLVPDDAYPFTSITGMKFADLSHQKCAAKLEELMNYEGLKKERDKLRKQGKYRGLGFAAIIEVTNPSPMFYGVGGAPISAQDGVTVRLEASGAVHVQASITEQGQGAETILTQIVADTLGLEPERVKVTTGDTMVTPYGGGTWGSRGTGIGGEAALQAGLALKGQLLDVASVMLQTTVDTLDLEGGKVVDKDSRQDRIALDELARTVYYRANELPSDIQPELVATRHYRVKDFPFVFTNGIMASYLEVDVDTGMIELLGHWVVEDCGRVINPRAVDEQIRGGVIQGIGDVLYEHCIYSPEGQLLTTTMADYLVPMAGEMPDIVIDHVETPTSTSALGAKGAGEAGTAGAPGAILNAINDALSPFDAAIYDQPVTPERVLKALGKV